MQPSRQSNILGCVSLILGVLSLAFVCLFAIAGLVNYIEDPTGIGRHGLSPARRSFARLVTCGESIALAGVVCGVAALSKGKQGKYTGIIGLTLSVPSACLFLPAAAVVASSWLEDLLARLF